MNKILIATFSVAAITFISLTLFQNNTYKISEKAEEDLISGATEMSQTSKNLEGTSWIFGEGGMLSFNNKRYSTTIGCNNISGTFVDDGNSINFNVEDIASTQTTCPGLEETEENLKRFLANTTTYKITDGTLIINGIDSTSLLLYPMVDVTLTETEWKIFSMKESDVTTHSVIDETTFLVLKDDFTFSGKSGCNSITGSYTIKGSVFSFSDMSSTKKLCSEEENAREQLLTTSLSNVSGYTIEGNILTLTSLDGNYTVRLSSK